jgi:hypothetical protein
MTNTIPTYQTTKFSLIIVGIAIEDRVIFPAVSVTRGDIKEAGMY